MYLTRAFLNPGSAAVRADLRSHEELHRTIMRAFPDDAGPTPRASHGVLYRLDRDHDARLVLLIQSRTRPTVERWPSDYVLDVGRDLDLAFSELSENPAVRSLAQERAAISLGDRFAFRLRANTTKRIGRPLPPDGKRRHGKRVPVHGHEGRVHWLESRAERSGFAFDRERLEVREVPPTAGGPKSITLAGALFEGVLRVQSVEGFRTALDNGIGPGRAFGYGLLSVRRLP